jgi:S-formylglutathione hydrolase FrmB
VSTVDGLSLTQGVIVRAVPALGAAAAAAGVTRRDRRWWVTTLPRLTLAAAGTVAAGAWYLHHSGTIPGRYPDRFRLWAGAALLSLLVAIVGWHPARPWRRAVSVAAVPLTVASLFVLVNAHYAYWPTFGDLLGRPMRDAVSAQTLNEMLAARFNRAAPTPITAGDGAPAPAPDRAPVPPPSPPEPTPVPAAGGADPDGLATPDNDSNRPGPVGAATGGDGVDPASTPDAAGEPDGRPEATVPHHRRSAHGTVVPPGATRSLAAAAGELHGTLAPLDIPATVSGFSSRPGTLYLPPAFFATPPPPLPVVVMLGGTPGGPQDWPRAGFATQAADAYASQHGGVAPILAFVDHNGSVFNDTECVDGPGGRAETFLVDDVPRSVADTLHIPLDPRRWAIAGFSEGGTCAFELAVRHPDVYGLFLDIAGDGAPNLGSDATTLRQLYGGDREAMAAHDPAHLLRPTRVRNLTGWFVVGASDSRHVTVADRLAAAAAEAGVATTRRVLPGSHNWQLAAAALRATMGPIVHEMGGDDHPAGSDMARA